MAECKKGYSCGLSCVSTSKSCSKGFNNSVDDFLSSRSKRLMRMGEWRKRLSSTPEVGGHGSFYRDSSESSWSTYKARLEWKFIDTRVAKNLFSNISRRQGGLEAPTVNKLAEYWNGSTAEVRSGLDKGGRIEEIQHQVVQGEASLIIDFIQILSDGSIAYVDPMDSPLKAEFFSNFGFGAPQQNGKQFGIKIDGGFKPLEL